MSIFAIVIAKIDIRIKKISALPEKPIKVPFRGFRGLQKRFLNLLSHPPPAKLFFAKQKIKDRKLNLLGT
jgi:hypothetical protein